MFPKDTPEQHVDVAAAYTYEVFVKKAADCNGKPPRFSDKEHKIQEHVQKSEEEAGKSKEEAKSIGYATVVDREK